jgi:hypothetical protein
VITSPKSDLYDSLRNLYQIFFDNLKREKVTIKKKSVLLTITASSSNIQTKILKTLEESCFESHLFKIKEIKFLLDEKLVRSSVYDLKSYVLTSKGIWFVEVEKDLISLDKFIDFVEAEILTEKIVRKLTDIEKTILFSLISIRCFDINSCMDINESYRADQWLLIFTKCRDFLYSNKLLKDKLKFKKIGHEHPASAEMRRINKLQIKTHFIYDFTGKKQYYLKISKGNKSKTELRFLFDLILSGNNEPDLLNEITKFCNDLAYNNTKYVTEISNLTRHYDDLIRSTIRSIIIGS